MIFSSILLAFFGLPITGLFLMSKFFPASIKPIAGGPLTINPSLELMPEPLGLPISVKKIRNKGNIIWVDAVDTVNMVEAMD
jgi:hypothetical protein